MRIDEVSWRTLLQSQDQVVSLAQAREVGWTAGAIEHRVGRDWQRLLRSVLLTVTGTPTQRQRWQAALLLAGPEAALTAGSGLELHELAEPETDVHVALPHRRRVRPSRFGVGGGEVVLHRTTRPLTRYGTDLPVLSAARCVVDVCLDATTFDEVRALVMRVVQLRRVTVDQLEHELDLASPRPGGQTFP